MRQQRVVVRQQALCADLHGLTPEEVRPARPASAKIVARTDRKGRLQLSSMPHKYHRGRHGRASTSRSRAIVPYEPTAAPYPIPCARRCAAAAWVTTHEDVTEREKLKTRARELQNEQSRMRLLNKHVARPRHVRQPAATADLQRALRRNVRTDARAGAAGHYGAPDPRISRRQRLLPHGRLGPGFHRWASSSGSTKRTTDVHELADGRIINVSAARDGQWRQRHHPPGHHRARETMEEAARS